MRGRKLAERLIIAVQCIFISGCVTAAMTIRPPQIPLASAKADTEAKRFETQPGKASIYVMREYAFTGQDSPSQVSLNEKDQGQLSPGTFFLFTVLPGRHAVAFKGKGDKGLETIYAIAGGIYYLEIRPQPGITASPLKITRIDRDRGRQLVLEGKRAGTKAARH